MVISRLFPYPTSPGKFKHTSFAYQNYRPENAKVENWWKFEENLRFRLKNRENIEFWDENGAFGTEIFRIIRISGSRGLKPAKSRKVEKSPNPKISKLVCCGFLLFFFTTKQMYNLRIYFQLNYKVCAS